MLIEKAPNELAPLKAEFTLAGTASSYAFYWSTIAGDYDELESTFTTFWDILNPLENPEGLASEKDEVS